MGAGDKLLGPNCMVMHPATWAWLEDSDARAEYAGSAEALDEAMGPGRVVLAPQSMWEGAFLSTPALGLRVAGERGRVGDSGAGPQPEPGAGDDGGAAGDRGL